MISLFSFVDVLGKKETGNLYPYLVFLLVVILFIVLFPNLKTVLWRPNKGNVSGAIDEFPGPLKLPFLGNSYVWPLFHPSKEILGWTRAAVKKWGPVFRMWNFSRPYIFISSSDLAIKLLREGLVDDKFEYLKNVSVAINGVGLVALDSEVHPKHRKLWNPFFNLKRIENSIGYMHSEGLKLLETLESLAGENSTSCRSQVFDLLPYVAHCTFDIACRICFGVDLNEAVSRDCLHQYCSDLHTISVNITERVFRPWLRSDWIYYKTTEGRKTKQCAERGANLIKKVIEFKRETRKCTDHKHQIANTCFLDRMLDLHEQGVLTDTQLLGELNVFVSAGSDTSGIVICIVIFYLSLHPEHQEKIVQELQEVLGSDFGNSSCPFTWDILKQFKYLELCIKECLRLFPLVPILPRRSTENIKLEDGRVIPRGVDVFINVDVIHRDPKYFPDPNIFRPERHSEGPIPAFMPFSIGNRNCVGQVYGMVTVKTIVAQLLMAYNWETTQREEDLQILYQTLQVPESVKCKIRKRLV
ncbi:unnamed protein product [Orchesella dallaii]|uniref:Cytochrome P450 4C1 n=1 Tax=Orchesella dallaii TaxID=48710 RepID=A0ABP1QLT9_9HEXA